MHGEPVEIVVFGTGRLGVEAVAVALGVRLKRMVAVAYRVEHLAVELSVGVRIVVLLRASDRALLAARALLARSPYVRVVEACDLRDRGFDALVAAVEGLDVEPRDPSVPRLPDPLELLSPRQVEVLRLLAAGLDDEEIARRLHIAPATLKFHLRSIMHRLGVRERGEAVVLLTREAGTSHPHGR